MLTLKDLPDLIKFRDELNETACRMYDYLLVIGLGSESDAVDSAIKKVNAKIDQLSPVRYSYNDCETEYDTLIEVQDACDYDLQYKAEDQNCANGATFEEWYVIHSWRYDENGDRIDANNFPYLAEYEYYHGDVAEHGRYA